MEKQRHAVDVTQSADAFDSLYSVEGCSQYSLSQKARFLGASPDDALDAEAAGSKTLDFIMPKG